MPRLRAADESEPGGTRAAKDSDAQDCDSCEPRAPGQKQELQPPTYPRIRIVDCNRRGHAGRAAYLTTRYRCQRSGTPFSSCSLASSNVRPEPAVKSFTVCETSTSEGPARAPTRAPITTAIPPAFPSIVPTSPVCMPDLIESPSGPRAWTMASAHLIARAGPSKVAKNPSPAVSTSTPR